MMHSLPRFEAKHNDLARCAWGKLQELLVKEFPQAVANALAWRHWSPSVAGHCPPKTSLTSEVVGTVWATHESKSLAVIVLTP